VDFASELDLDGQAVNRCLDRSSNEVGEPLRRSRVMWIGTSKESSEPAGSLFTVDSIVASASSMTFSTHDIEICWVASGRNCPRKHLPTPSPSPQQNLEYVPSLFDKVSIRSHWAVRRPFGLGGLFSIQLEDHRSSVAILHPYLFR
jgi:hypothetical protein